MKGTLFSADFIEDSNGELRLLEINTDTQATNLQFFDYTDFISVLSQNNITKVTVIHKPHIHQEMVNHMSSSLSVNAPFITTFTEIKEGPNILYPTSVPDQSDLFILRLAYDESSIFDSEYAKGTLNLLKLYTDYNESGSVAEFYHSSSLNGFYNTITPQSNPTNLPDYVLKSTSEGHSFAEFYKLGSESESDTDVTKWDNFLTNKSNETVLIEKYHINSNTILDNKVSSIRSFSIIYGSDLSLIHLAQYKAYSVFELPTVEIYNSGSYVNKIDTKHYYEFATNIIKYEGVFDGILNTHLIIKSDNTLIEAGNIVVGDELKSFYIGNTSLNEIFYENWQITGNTLPSGSYMTSSVVMYKNSKQLENKTLVNLTVNNNEDSLFVAPLKAFLVYDSVDDMIKWKTAAKILPTTDNLIDYDGSTAQVTSNEVYITNDDGFSLIELDVEDTDTYIISGTTSINAFVTHNSPCFVEGTKIMLFDGTLKNIEDVLPGDVVSTYNLKENRIVNNTVKNVLSKTVDRVVKYTFENGETLICTIDHPIYVINKGWSSFDDDVSNKSYSIEENVKKIEVGDTIKLYDGDTTIVNVELIIEDKVVYNLQDIENNHNYFANNVLVHNRFCFIAGTQVKMGNGSSKNIEDVVIGDEVISFNESTGEREIKRVTDIKSPVHHELVKYTFNDENGETYLICTTDHPIYVNGLNLSSFNPTLTSKRYDLGRPIQKIQIGDKINLSNDIITEISNIEELPIVETKTYIITVEDNSNFYANDVLVHNKACFVSGTLITLENNQTKKIEDIVVGEKVLTYNESTNENEVGVVGNLKVHEVNEVMKLTFDFEVITTTPEHPFYVINRGWVKSKDLSIGDVCLRVDGIECELKTMEILQEQHTVYNLLSVSDNHNFYANGILVHNKL